MKTNMILLGGKKLSEKILDELKADIAASKKELRLAAVVVGEDEVTKKFIEQKKKAASFVRVDFRIYGFPENISTNDLRKRVAGIVHEKKNSGVIIQLPLPAHINTQYILNAVPQAKDVDVLSVRALGSFAVGKSSITPPVVGAIKMLFEEYGIDYRNKYTVLVGAGNLVGKPAALWLLNEKATFSVVRSSTQNLRELLKNADIIISGVGKPKFVTGDMVKEGVVVIDAGTSVSRQSPVVNDGRLEAESRAKVRGSSFRELGAAIAGDIDFEFVAPKASYITPVPGGVGPIAVAMILKNLLVLSKLSRR